MKNVFEARRRTLESRFFSKIENEQIEQIRKRQREREAKQAISECTGVDSEEELEALVRLGFDGTSIAALTLVPLLEVAWVDNDLDSKEKEKILQATASFGIGSSDPSYVLLEKWLKTKPSSELYQAWEDFMEIFARIAEPGEYKMVSQRVLDWSKKVAEASGGVLGIGSISAKERLVLEHLEQVT